MKIILPTLPEPAPRLTSPQPARIVPFGSPPPDAADEDFADGSVEMNGDGSQLRVALALQAAQPLTSDRTIYVNSATGNDANAGTQAAPFQTFARAWAERQKYGVLRAKFTIQLLGAGPYTAPSRLGVSLADVGGFLIIRGDDAVDVTHYTGAFTGNFATNGTIGTDPGLGTDTHRHRFVKITSGPASGCVFLILKHTDTLITACNKRFLSAGTFTITAGTTFKVFTPGTQISVSTRADGWLGGDPILNQSVDVRHVFLNLACTGAFGALNSTLAIICCTMTSGPTINSSQVTLGIWTDSTIFGAPQHAYRSAGVVGGGGSFIDAYVTGTYSTTDSATTINIQFATFDHIGGRLGGSLSSSFGNYRLLSTGGGNAAYRFDKTLIADNNSAWNNAALGVTIIEFAVTSGSCIRVMHGSRLHSEVALSGGTSDPAGYGIDVSSSGFVCMIPAPTLTGGTAGKDLKTTNNGGVANSVLSAAGTAAGVAADALLGEVLARVA